MVNFFSSFKYMIKDILIIFLFIIIIYIIYVDIYEYMGNDNNFKYLNNEVSSIVYNNVYSTDEYIEITKLPSCEKKIKSDYGTNINTINNDNYSIYQNIIDPLFHTIEIDNKNYNLMSISWKKSNFSYNDKKVGLELHLNHKNYISLYSLIIVIPLDFVNDNINAYNENTENTENTKEDFKNIGYSKMIDLPNQEESNPLFIKDQPDPESSSPTIKVDEERINLEKRKEFQKNTFNLNSNSKSIINDLLYNELFIPEYKCCVDTISQVQKFNLCNLTNIVLENTTYYQLEDHNNNVYYITPPIKFPENIGLDIKEKIQFNTTTRFLKEDKSDI